MLYVAYGSNINVDQMNYRVPGAKPYGKGIVYNWQLDFHGNDGSAYATITQAPGKKVPVVLWELSEKEESLMDRYEGYPKSYYKKKIPVHINGERKEGLVYIMDESRKVARPSRKYVNTVRIGYEKFGLDLQYLQDALERNSKEYYLDDLLEVREFKPLKKVSKQVNKKDISSKKQKKGNKSKKTYDFSWKVSERAKKVTYPDVPVDLGSYMSKTFPKDPYWYGYDSVDTTSKRGKPSLDDYDWYPSFN